MLTINTFGLVLAGFFAALSLFTLLLHGLARTKKKVMPWIALGMLASSVVSFLAPASAWLIALSWVTITLMFVTPYKTYARRFTLGVVFGLTAMGALGVISLPAPLLITVWAALMLTAFVGVLYDGFKTMRW